jgi:hypothetical protein
MPAVSFAAHSDEKGALAEMGVRSDTLGRDRSDTVLVHRISGAVKTMASKTAILIVFSAVMTIVSILAVVLTRPTHVEATDLVNANGQLIGTGLVTVTKDLADMPASADFEECECPPCAHPWPSALFALHRPLPALHPQTAEALRRAPPTTADDSVKSIVFGSVEDGMQSASVQSWHWSDAERMSWTTTQGDVLIDHGQIAYAGPTDTVVTFGTTDQPAAAGKQASSLSDSVIAQARSQCAELQCPLKSCTAKLAPLEIIREVSCHDTTLWRWPEGVSLRATSARHLSVGKWKVKKIKTGGSFPGR